MNDKSTTATVEELFGMPVDQVRTAFGREFARRRIAINGYEMIGLLGRLSEGFIGRDPYSNEKIICYWKGKNGTSQVWFEVEERTVDALLRMLLIERRDLPAEAAPSFGKEFYVLTATGQRFFANIPEKYRSGELSDREPREDREFWTVIVEETPDLPPLVYPWIAAEAPDARAVISQYADGSPAMDIEPRVSGPHSLRWIPPSALAFDEHPPLEGKVGPRIIRSWFDTVINPMLADLKHDERMLVLRNWTWRVPPGHLESLRPIEESPWQVSVDNLEQLISFYPHVEGLIERHDGEATELEDACRALHNSFAVSQPVKDAYAKAKDDNSLTGEGKPINGVLRGPEERDLDLLAQYIVNTADELPDYYVYSPVWNKYKSEFLISLEDSAVRPLRDATVQAGEKLLGTVNDLTAVLKQIRARLSLQFDVPFITGQSAPEE